MKKEVVIGLIVAAIIAALVIFGMITYAEHVRDDADAKAKIAIEQAKAEAAEKRIGEIKKESDDKIKDLEKRKQGMTTAPQVQKALDDFSPFKDTVVLPPEAPPQKSVLTFEDAKKQADFAISCRQCEIARDSATSQGEQKDAIIVSLTRERDLAIAEAKGGGFFKRVKRNSKWFVIGAVAGAVALKATGH